MSTTAPADGGTNPSHLKEKMKHPFEGLREKLRDTKLYDLKVGLIHKKYVSPPMQCSSLTHPRHELGKLANLVGSLSCSTGVK